MFISKSDAVLQVQNKVQEVTVKLSDNQVVSVVGNVATVKIGEPVADIRCALHVNASTLAVEVASAAIVNDDGIPTTNGQNIKCTLTEIMEASDCLIVRYVINEQVKQD